MRWRCREEEADSECSGCELVYGVNGGGSVRGRERDWIGLGDVEGSVGVSSAREGRGCTSLARVRFRLEVGDDPVAGSLIGGPAYQRSRARVEQRGPLV